MIEELDDIIEEMADRKGAWGAHPEDAGDNCECRNCFTSGLGDRIRRAVAIESTLNPQPAESIAPVAELTATRDKARAWCEELLAERDFLLPDAMKWRAAMREAAAMKVDSLDTAKGAILSLVQQLEAASDKRLSIETRITHLETALRAEQARCEGLERELGERKDGMHQAMLDWRGVETPCKRCGGSGRIAYGNTATWHGGIGGSMMTADVCNGCWGSGDENRKGVDLRRVSFEDVRALRADLAEARRQLVALPPTGEVER